MSDTQPKISVSPETFNIYPSSGPESCVQLTNVSFVPILYRALSTAPKQFQVRPRQGFVASGKSETIVVTYSNKDEAPVSGVDRKEEFKIEYCRMTEEHAKAIEEAGGNASIVTDLIKQCAKADKKSKVISCVIAAAAPATTAVETNFAASAPATTAARTSEKVAAVTASDIPAAPVPKTAPAPEAAESKNAPASKSQDAAASSAPLPPQLSRASERNATTSLLSSTATEKKSDEDTTFRSRASTAGRPSASAAASAPALPPPTPNGAAAAGKNDGGKLVTFTEDPITFLKQNPVIAAGILIGLYLIAKLLF